MYHAGHGVPHDDARASDLLRRAGEQGSGGAAALLGAGYAEGWAGARDDAQALRWWFSHRSRIERPDGWLGLARMHDGRGVAQDGLEAAVWYAMAANAGRTGAQLRLGDAAHLGQLAQMRDEQAAVRWYRLAAEHDPVAAWHLASMAEARARECRKITTRQ